MGRTRRTAELDPDVRFLAALADPTRLAIVRQLAAEQDVCACDFTSCCDVGQPTVSHHLKVLREAGVVESERRGNWIFYRLLPEAAERLVGIARSVTPGATPAGGLDPGRGSRGASPSGDRGQRSGLSRSGVTSQRSVPAPA
ncbi:MAG: ArsR/SmtB family transcription factor [Candidatus Limnocylindrales bacterium]